VSIGERAIGIEGVASAQLREQPPLALEASCYGDAGERDEGEEKGGEKAAGHGEENTGLMADG
jgi:hypothetical protein